MLWGLHMKTELNKPGWVGRALQIFPSLPCSPHDVTVTGKMDGCRLWPRCLNSPFVLAFDELCVFKC